MGNPLYDKDELEIIDYAVLTLSTTGAITLSTTGTNANCTPTINSTTFGNKKVKRAYITIETTPCRFRMDGTAPTAGEGHLLNVGDTLNLASRPWGTLLNSLTSLRFIATTGAPKGRITFMR